MQLHRWSLLVFAFFLPGPARAYRPFVSTDAAVAARHELEIELGYFSLQRADHRNTFVVPQLRLNYGLLRDCEVVAEFAVEKPPDGDAQLVGPGLFLKGVLKEGVLQGQNGLGVAVEAGALLPPTTPGERRLGFESVGILSGRLLPLTYHVNFGGGVVRENAFAVWGVIVEAPVLHSLRLVGEINGESTETQPPDNSSLLGFIWQPAASAVLIDAGIRRGISQRATDWAVTTGVTFRFPLLPGPQS